VGCDAVLRIGYAANWLKQCRSQADYFASSADDDNSTRDARYQLCLFRNKAQDHVIFPAIEFHLLMIKGIPTPSQGGVAARLLRSTPSDGSQDASPRGIR
jgi:hypothetical protein